MSLLESFEVIVLVAGLAILMWDNRLAVKSNATARPALTERLARDARRPRR
jgi:hypothetical protein